MFNENCQPMREKNNIQLEDMINKQIDKLLISRDGEIFGKSYDANIGSKNRDDGENCTEMNSQVEKKNNDTENDETEIMTDNQVEKKNNGTENDETEIMTNSQGEKKNNDTENDETDIMTNSQDKQWMPRTLIIENNGIQVLQTLGFLCVMEDGNILKYTDTYCGISLGAIICLLMVAGYKVREIIDEMIKLGHLKDIYDFIDEDKQLTNEAIRKKLTQLILNKFGMVPNLNSLYMQTGLSLNCVTFNETDNETEIMGPFTHKNVSCIDAVIFSINVAYKNKLIYKNKIYVNGILGHPYPVKYFDNGNTNILGIYNIQQTLKTKNLSGINPVIINFFKMINININQRISDAIQQSSTRCKHISFGLFINIFTNLDDHSRQAFLLVNGFNEGIDFLDKLSNDSKIPVSVPKFFTYPLYYLSGEDNDDNYINISSTI